MRFTALDFALTTQLAVAPRVRRVQRHDRKLAQQLRDATNSFLLNLGEGSHADPGTRRSRYHSAAGSASEMLVGLRASIGWGYFREEDARDAMGKLDRLLGTLLKLTHWGQPGVPGENVVRRVVFDVSCQGKRLYAPCVQS